MFTTPILSLTPSFRIRSLLVTPHAHLHIFISATSSFCVVLNNCFMLKIIATVKTRTEIYIMNMLYTLWSEKETLVFWRQYPCFLEKEKEINIKVRRILQQLDHQYYQCSQGIQGAVTMFIAISIGIYFKTCPTWCMVVAPLLRSGILEELRCTSINFNMSELPKMKQLLPVSLQTSWKSCVLCKCVILCQDVQWYTSRYYTALWNKANKPINK